MNHWHECRNCKEHFECRCNTPTKLSASCADCVRMRRETLLIDSVALGLLHITAD